MDRRTLPMQIEVEQPEAALGIREQRQPFNPKRSPQAPQDAPNVLLVLVDDMGFGASSAFGGPCQMPAAEQLAAGGLRYSRFHTTAVCSPTRAALMTGRNHHSVGMGSLPELATSAPGYDGIRPRSAGTLAQTLNYNGYATGVFGKWHQTPQWEQTEAGPFDHWPAREGFEKFYGFFGGMADQFAPPLVDGLNFVEPPATEEEGYHLSEDLVDRTQDWIRVLRAGDAAKPWFAYLSFGATHSPFHVPREWRDRRRGEFAHGWDEQRRITLERQKQLGVVPEDTELAPWVGGVPHWDELDETQRLVAERLMETYAAFAEHTDAQVGRLTEFLRERGELDNTLVLYVLGDNGASPEGGFEGSINETRRQNGIEETAAEMVGQLEQVGGPTTFPHYPTGWALALDTPYQWAKIVASHYGGTRNGLIVHWPERIAARGEIRNQWHHVIDVLPTVLEAAGLPQPEAIDGIEQDPVEGTSFLYSFEDADAAERHTTQYFEVFGNRGIYHEGWTAVTKHLTPWEFFHPGELPAFEDDRWELYDTNSDWSQARDLAAEQPEKLAELQELFLAEARRHDVLPLDDRSAGERLEPGQVGRRQLAPHSALLTPRDRRMVRGTVPSLKNTSFKIAVELEAEADSDGVLVAQGGWGAGWSLFVERGRPVYAYNMLSLEWTYVESPAPVGPGRHRVELEFDYDDGGRGKGGTAWLRIDGETVASGRLERTVPILGGYVDILSVGADRGSPVTDRYPRGGGNAYTGRIESVAISAGEDPVGPADEDVVKSVLATQ